MENASKALLMAAGVLMGVLILSLAVYLFTTLNASAKENYEQMKTNEIAQFNSFYLAYNGRTDLTYYEVWSIINKAKDFNASEEDENNHIDLYIHGTSTGSSDGIKVNTKNISITNLNIALGSEPIAIPRVGDTYISEEKNGLVLRKFRCEVGLNSGGRVKDIHFWREKKTEET